jgi:CHASE3 domain sensor protein
VEFTRWKRRLRAVDWRIVPVLALVVIATATSYGYHRLLLAERDLVEHTYEVISTLEAILQQVTDAETGQRGFILTGDDTYLKPYHQSLVNIRLLPVRLSNLVRDNLAQLARTVELDAAVQAKLEELAGTIETRKRQGSEIARSLVSSNIGRDRMEKVRAVVAEMRHAEAELLLQRTAQAARTERSMLIVTIALALLSLGSRIGLYWVSKHTA